MKIGVILEGKNPPDKRVPFSPEQVSQLKKKYPQSQWFVQSSPIRAFLDSEYREKGIEVVDDISHCDVLFGVKEVNIEDLIPNKTYFFFSHTIKKQPYNRDLLRAVLDKNIRLIDYECLTEASGRRLVGFGRYAGIVGCYNAFLAYGKRTGRFDLKAAHECRDRKEMESYLSQVNLPTNYKIALTGLGRVAGGAIEILERLGIPSVSSDDFLNKQFNEPVYAQLSVEDYFASKNDEDFVRRDVFAEPWKFKSNFAPFARVADMYIPCHYWDSRGPVIFTKEEMKAEDFKIRLIADISCDIDGPIPSTLRPSTIADPIYQVDRKRCVEIEELREEAITVMAVDNLPCELPKDASEDFGEELMNQVIPCLLGPDPTEVINRASIANGGELGGNFGYLEDYVAGKD